MICKPFEQLKGTAIYEYYSGELADCHQRGEEFLHDIIKKYNLKMEEGYHLELRNVGIVNSDELHPHYSDHYIKAILTGMDEIVAMIYHYRNSANGGGVIMIDLLNKA